MDGGRRLLMLLALLCWVGHACGQDAVAAEDVKEQVQAVFMFVNGPCFPVSQTQVTEVINDVLNPITGSPWGTATQSGGYESLCKKLPKGCGAPYSANKGPAPEKSSSPAPAKAPAPAPSKSPAPGSRRLLADSPPCTPGENSKWYLYVDTTDPVDSQWVMDELSASLEDGRFMGRLELTSVKATSVVLKNFNLITATPDDIKANTAAAFPQYAARVAASPSPSLDGSGSGDSAASGDSASDVSGDLSSEDLGAVSTSSTSTSTDSSSSSSSGGGGSNKTVLIIVIASVVGGVMIAAAVFSYMVHSRRKAKARLDSQMLVHRWEKERDQAASSDPKSAGGRSPFDRAASIHSAKSMADKDLDHDSFSSYKAPKLSSQRSALGLGSKKAVTPEKEGVLPKDAERSSPPQVPPAGKKSFKFGNK